MHADILNSQFLFDPYNHSHCLLSTQNENGPCPLIALANVLLLSHRIKIENGETIVTTSHLMDLLGSCLLEQQPSNHKYSSANYQQNMQDSMAVFPKLQTGLDVNVKFNRYVSNALEKGEKLGSTS